ncbi:MAG: hypothetical protein IKQ09_06465 [Bacteroidales bacterium]|nr:hypothetical protein [Bacteroidales bacterium]
MKKILLATALVLAMGLGANAQRDSFFNDWEDVGNGLDRPTLDLPALPSAHGFDDNQSAPLGSGLLVLTALGAGYMVARRRKE